MSDLISRQDAIEAIKKHKHNILDGGEWDKGIEYGYAAAHNHICEVISHIPTAKRVRKRERERKNTMRWIPVTERLPDISGSYLATVYNGKHSPFVNVDYFFKSTGEWDYYRVDVIAWAEMPEPWKGDGDEAD